MALAVTCDERVCNVVDGTGRDPFSSVQASGDQDGLATFRRIVVGWVNTDTQSRDVTTFVGGANVDYAHVSSEERGHQSHPRLDDR